MGKPQGAVRRRPLSGRPSAGSEVPFVLEGPVRRPRARPTARDAPGEGEAKAATPLSADKFLSVLKNARLGVVEHGSWRTHNRDQHGNWGP